MSKDFYEIGGTPADESCAGVDHVIEMRAECKRFKALLEKVFEPLMKETGIYFGIKGNPHDFGTYYEVCVYFDDEDANQLDAMLFVEDKAPDTWNDETIRTKHDFDAWREIRKTKDLHIEFMA